jgi:DNA adenine methylase
MTTNNPKPFLKWVGGKTRLMKKIEEYFPDNYNRYFEPFLGGGSVFFNFTPNNAFISDLNKTLIDTYESIRDNFDELFKYLQILEKKNTPEDYYEYRRQFNRLRNDEKRQLDTKTYVSALMIYLNKTGYGGVYRENKKGGYNVPYGKYKNINITDEKNLLKVKQSLKNVSLFCSHYSDILKNTKKGDFIYLDPPYHKENKTSFTTYNKGGFNEMEQKKLAILLKKLDEKGVMFLLSNSNTTFINELYKDFTIIEVTVGRHINNKNKRKNTSCLGPIGPQNNSRPNEVLIFNYPKENLD